VGDDPSFERFVAARSDALLRTAFLLTGNWASAEDLLQTALAKCWRQWSHLSDQPDNYVRTVIVHTYLSWRRRRWHGEIPVADLPDRPGLESTSGVDDRAMLWTALRRLPRRQRAVVVLRYYDDLSEARTAELLGVSVGTVKSQSSKALAALRVDPDLDVHPPKRGAVTGVVDDAGVA
jgi:RNA polymerase sigma-70 factor (sigma-E family)